MLYKEFYSELGKLLYAVADIDKVITQQEKLKLQKIVREELVPYEKHTDEFGTIAAFYSEIEFDFSDEQFLDSEAAFNSFIDFITEHHTAFDAKMKRVCIHVVKEIASSYRGINKKENELIKELRDKLNLLDIRNNKSHSGEVGVDPLFSAEPKEDFENEPIEQELVSNYGNMDDIIEEYNHKLERRLKRMNDGSVNKIYGSNPVFIW